MLLKKIAVSGLGGVGGYYGAMLMQEAEREGAGREVYFIARTAHAEAIKANGLEVFTPSRHFSVKPTAVFDSTCDLVAEKASNRPKMDLIIVATKSYDLESNIRQLLPLIGEQTIILPLLNGANISERVQSVVPNNIVWYGCTYISGRKKDAGQIELLDDKELFLFGSAGGEQTAHEAELLELLLRSGIKGENPLDIMTTIYRKFAMISATATGTSYFNCTVGEALSQHSEAMNALVDEVCDLMEQKGLQDIEEAKAFIKKRQHIMPQHTTSSMHVDFISGAKTELENLTGYVVKEGKKFGVALPYYTKMYEALKAGNYPNHLNNKS